MKKTNEDVEMLDEYDFSHSKPSPYARLAGDVHVVTLHQDVWAFFPDSEAVNTALRSLIAAKQR